jgi:hypothetical protein
VLGNDDSYTQEDQIFPNKKQIGYWIYQQYIPGIYSSNIHGMGYSKSTAIAIKGNYPKGQDVKPVDRFKSTMNAYFGKPKMRSDGK